MQAITVRDRDAGTAGMSLTDLPYPHAAENDVIVRVHASGFTPGELDWPATWADRAGRDRTPSVPGHELSGVVVELGYGTTGLSVGQRVFGLADWTRNGTLAEYTAVEARNLAPLPADIDHTLAAALPISGLTAWQALFDHGRLTTGQTVLIHGAAGGVGTIATQLCVASGAHVIATASARDAQYLRGLGVTRVIDYKVEPFENETRNIDAVLDFVGGDTTRRSFIVTKRGGVVVSTVGEIDKDLAREARVVAVRMVMQPNADDLREIAGLVEGGIIKPHPAHVMPLVAAREAQELYESGLTDKVVLDAG